MGEQVLGLQVALPDATLLRRHSRVRRDNTGYDLPALFVGAEGTLGVITDLEVRLHRPARHRVTAVCGFTELAALVDAGRIFADLDGVAALEVIDGAALVLTDEYQGCLPRSRAPGFCWWRWPPTTIPPRHSARPWPRYALRRARGRRRRRGAPSAVADPRGDHRHPGVFGPPLKFDVSLPLEEIAGFTSRAAAVIAEHAPRRSRCSSVISARATCTSMCCAASSPRTVSIASMRP